MTKRSARKLIRQYADNLNARHEPGVNTCSAARAYGTVQRELAGAGIDLDMDERVALLAYAYGYVEATTGVREPRDPTLADRIDARTDDHAAGMKAGGSS